MSDNKYTKYFFFIFFWIYVWIFSEFSDIYLNTIFEKNRPENSQMWYRILVQKHAKFGTFR